MYGAVVLIACWRKLEKKRNIVIAQTVIPFIFIILFFCRNTTGETRRWSYPLSSGRMSMWTIRSKIIASITRVIIWSIGYFVSTAGINEEVVKKYIKMQGEEDSGQAKLEF